MNLARRKQGRRMMNSNWKQQGISQLQVLARPHIGVPLAIIAFSVLSADVDGDDASSAMQVTRRHSFHTNSFSSLSDVWLCLLCGLGWTVWLVASYSKPKMEHYNDEGILILGHVLQIVLNPDGRDLSGIPSFGAIVDYKLEQYDPPLQVRKSFQTDTLLEVGFSNVELLVLPFDPQSAVLKREWEREYQEYLDSLQSRERGQQYSLALGAVLVLLSLIGAARAVSRLPAQVEFWGWVSIVVAMAGMWPFAVSLYSLGSWFMDTAMMAPGRKGVIVSGELPASAQPLAHWFSWVKGSRTTGATFSTPQGSTDSGGVTTPRASNRQSVEDLWNRTRLHGAIPPAKTTDEDEGNAACYIVNLPLPKWKGRARSGKSQTSISTLSESNYGNSTGDRARRKPSSSTGTGLELPSLGEGPGSGSLV